jgi:hypothetical protein
MPTLKALMSNPGGELGARGEESRIAGDPDKLKILIAQLCSALNERQLRPQSHRNKPGVAANRRLQRNAVFHRDAQMFRAKGI